MAFAQQLGRYHLLDRIAFGGMAEVYRAKTFDSRGMEHVVAIKRVLRHLSEDDDFLQMLVDEAKIVSLLDHECIAKVYEFVRVSDEYFIAMEYVHGKDLRSILDRCRIEGLWLSPVDCAFIMMRTLEALHAAHEKRDGAGIPFNIVHRDVSPSNIIVAYSGQVKLCDFGIAKASLSRIQTRTGVIKGKVKYMSPEQAMGRPLDRRTDLFSGGSVLYEMLTKQCPFQAENEMELIFRVRDAKYPRPSRYNPNIPSKLERILRKALHLSLSARYQTAQQFAEDLRDFIFHEAPDYSPTRLGRIVSKIFAEEMNRDDRMFSEFELMQADPAALGDNLIAEVLGEGAPYTKFTPVGPLDTQRSEELKTRIMPRVPPPETRLPEGVELHDLKTEILDPEERVSRVLKRKHRKKPGADHTQQKKRGTQQATILRHGADRDQRDTEPERVIIDNIDGVQQADELQHDTPLVELEDDLVLLEDDQTPVLEPTSPKNTPRFHDLPTQILRKDNK